VSSDALDAQDERTPSSSTSEQVQPDVATLFSDEQVSCQPQSAFARCVMALCQIAGRRFYKWSAQAAKLAGALVTCARTTHIFASAAGKHYLAAPRLGMASRFHFRFCNRAPIAQSLMLLASVLLLIGLPGPASRILSQTVSPHVHVSTGASAAVPRTIQASVSGEVGSPSADTAAVIAMSPHRLIIPKMGLNAKIDALGPDPTGAMQAPQPSNPNAPVLRDVYWWDVGALPGQVGNAVIAGHINRPDGSPATFGNLYLLNPGDRFQVVTADGTVLTFAVTATDDPLVYVHGGNDPTIQRIFGPADSPQLNLLTCWGKWDGAQYNRRLVVYSILVAITPPSQVP